MPFHKSKGWEVGLFYNLDKGYIEAGKFDKVKTTVASPLLPIKPLRMTPSLLWIRAWCTTKTDFDCGV